MFKRTSLPVARSIHYQLIDIQLDEVQQMVHSNDDQVRKERKYFFFFLISNSQNDREVCFMTGAFFFLYKHTCRILIRGLIENGAFMSKRYFIYIKKRIFNSPEETYFDSKHQ
jgi:hypothetical protein